MVEGHFMVALLTNQITKTKIQKYVYVYLHKMNTRMIVLCVSNWEK